MAEYGLLFDAQYCVGCMSCTVACKQEHGFDANTWGIRVTELIYERPDGKVMVEYMPYPTDLCTLCAARIQSGEDDKPSCVKHCMTQCISYGKITDLAQKMKDMSRAIMYSGK